MGVYHSHNIAWILKNVETPHHDFTNQDGMVGGRIVEGREFHFKATVPQIALHANARIPQPGEQFRPETFTGDYEIQGIVTEVQVENDFSRRDLRVFLTVKDLPPIS